MLPFGKDGEGPLLKCEVKEIRMTFTEFFQKLLDIAEETETTDPEMKRQLREALAMSKADDAKRAASGGLGEDGFEKSAEINKGRRYDPNLL